MSAIGKTSGGITLAGWRAVRTTERRAIGADLAARSCSRRASGSASASSVAPSSVRPVFARNTSSSDGARSSRSTMSTPFASTARTMSVSPSPSRRRTATSRVVSRRSPNGARNAAIFSRSFSFRGIACTLGRPISAFSSAGVPSATILPWSMIPTRSARTSASSRYCVVRKTVTPSSRRSRATSSQSAVRLCGSSPVVGSSRKRIRGRWTSASARSRRRFMPPE